MAKSSKKQCRTRKPPRQGGGLVVVSQRDVLRVAKPGPSKAAKKAKGKKKKISSSSLAELMASGDGNESDDFDTPLPTHRPCSGVAGAGGINEFIFASSQHSLEQRLYYLLATRPAPPQQPGEVGSTGGTPGGAGGVGGACASASAGAAMEGGCHALVFVETTAAAQELVGELKALGLVVFALHERTPKAQAQEHVKRFLAAPSAERSSALILTNSATTRSPSIGPVQGTFLRIVHFDQPEGEKNAAARERVAGGLSRGRSAETMQKVHLKGAADTVGLAPFSFDSAAMAGIRSRLVVAKKLSRAVALSADEGEERGMRRAAAAAGLEWDSGIGQSGESGAEAAKREKRRGHAQQAAALRQKLSVLLCQPLLPPTPATVSATGSSTPVTTAAPKNARQSAKELRKKMVVLGMIHGPQAGIAEGGGPSVSAAAGKERRTEAPEDRTAALTRWLDGSAGNLFGGTWGGDVRTGASCDRASLEVRAQVEAAKQTRNGTAAVVESGSGGSDGANGMGGRKGDLTATAALAKWKPNPDTPDPEKWGGRWGKPCGHNEVVLQHLRPFAPMEVVNTRVCSKESPAPGNAGFDGCLELLSLTCRAHERALTVWDDASFVHIDRTGACSSLPKQTMLHLSLPTLRFLMKNMRSFTVCGGGQHPPRDVARAVIRLVGWGAKQTTLGPLSVELSRRVMSFVLTGDLGTWRSMSGGLGVGRGLQAASSTGKAPPRDTLAFASKKKRKNFNL